MNNITNIIKNEYFSEKNNNFITDIIINKLHVPNSNKNIIFKLQNEIYNKFIEEMYDKQIPINEYNIEDLLISLNKLTIKLIQESIIPISHSEPQIPLPPLEPQIPPQPLLLPTLPIQLQLEPQNQQLKNQIQEQQNQLQKQLSIVKKRESETSSYLHFFNDNDNTFKINEKCKSIVFKQFNFFNNFYNITEHNNQFELIDTSKYKIQIPIGNYNLESLLDYLEKQINIKTKAKYTLTYNQQKNRIVISNNNSFEIKFNTGGLKDILGFSKIEYMNNNSYTSDTCTQLNWIDTIYIVCTINGVPLNKYKTNCNFEYSICVDTNIFGKYNKVTLNEHFNITTENCVSDITMSFYTKCKNKEFVKLNTDFSFDFILQLK